jgi:hypothetical protein
MAVVAVDRGCASGRRARDTSLRTSDGAGTSPDAALHVAVSHVLLHLRGDVYVRMTIVAFDSSGVTAGRIGSENNGRRSTGMDLGHHSGNRMAKDKTTTHGKSSRGENDSRAENSS